MTLEEYPMDELNVESWNATTSTGSVQVINQGSLMVVTDSRHRTVIGDLPRLGDTTRPFVVIEAHDLPALITALQAVQQQLDASASERLR